MKRFHLLAIIFAIVFLSATSSIKAKDADLMGSLRDGEVHFSAPDNEYIFKGTIHIKNNSDKDYENLLLVFDVPEEVDVPMSYEDPVKLDTIKAGKTLEQEVVFKMEGGDLGSQHTLTTHLAIKNNNGELTKVAELKGSTDISIMKGDYSEVNGTITGQVDKDEEGNFILNITVKGTNHSVYEIKEKDNIFVAFELPYDLTVEKDNLPEGVFTTLSWAMNNGYAVPISVGAGKTFSFNFTLPLSGELDVNQMDDTNKNIYLMGHQPEAMVKFHPNGIIKGETNIDYSAMMDEKQMYEEEAEKDGAKNEKPDKIKTASSSATDTKAEDASFFGIPFFVGALIGFMLATIIFMFILFRKKGKD